MKKLFASFIIVAFFGSGCALFDGGNAKYLDLRELRGKETFYVTPKDSYIMSNSRWPGYWISETPEFSVKNGSEIVGILPKGSILTRKRVAYINNIVGDCFVYYFEGLGDVVDERIYRWEDTPWSGAGRPKTVVSWIPFDTKAFLEQKKLESVRSPNG